eukprot:SAG11_NODE_1003_length_6211_cov_6.104548_3_plen_62_part_00
MEPPAPEPEVENGPETGAESEQKSWSLFEEWNALCGPGGALWKVRQLRAAAAVSWSTFCFA